MLYAGSCWSELPICTSKEQEANGEQFGYEFLIDEALGVGLEIQRDKQLELYISQQLSFSLDNRLE